MSSRLKEFTTDPFLHEFAIGASQSAASPVATFLAPTIWVPEPNGRFKKYTEKSRFHIPETKRAPGGKATQVSMDASDEKFSLEHHALDFPVDNLESVAHSAIRPLLEHGAMSIAESAALQHEKAVLDQALEVLGAGEDHDTSNASLDIVDLIDQHTLEVMKKVKYGGLMGIRILFGAEAARRIKNHPKIVGRFTKSSSNRGNKMGTPSIEEITGLFLGNPETQVSWMVHDTAGPGEDENIEFLLNDSVIIFASRASGDLMDPSFMKTFRLKDNWMVPGSYVKEDGRGEVAKLDWSEDVQVTNTAAAVRLNFTAS